MCPYASAGMVKMVINWVILDCLRWLNFKNFFNHGEGMEYTCYKLSHSRLFQMIKFQNFLQPWWRNGLYFDDKLSHSRLFQMAKFQKILQPWWRNGIYFGDKLSHSRLFQMARFQNILQPWWRNGIYFGDSIINFIIIFFKLLVRKNCIYFRIRSQEKSGN